VSARRSRGTTLRLRVGAPAAVLVALALAAVACSDDSTSSGTTTAKGSAPEVVLVTYDAFALPEAAAKEFTKQTGAKIKVVASGDAGAVLTKALLSAGAPEGDVLFGVDNTLATRVTDEDLLSPYTPPGAAAVPDALKLPGRLGTLLTPIDTGDVCVNVDAGWFTRKGLAPPTTLDDLADPRYKDLLVVESPVTSSPGLAFLIGTVQRYGADGWPDYWSRLKANGVKVRPSWDDAYTTDYTVSGGDRPLVVSYASSPPAEVVYGEGKVTEPASTVMADTCVSQVEYAGVLKGAEHAALARKLVAFMTGPAWQEALPLSNFVYPAVPGTALPAEFQKWAAQPASPRTIDPLVIGKQRDTWIEQWRDLME
jgi:thiamine transport system substrate-binding protein